MAYQRKFQYKLLWPNLVIQEILQNLVSPVGGPPESRRVWSEKWEHSYENYANNSRVSVTVGPEEETMAGGCVNASSSAAAGRRINTCPGQPGPVPMAYRYILYLPYSEGLREGHRPSIHLPIRNPKLRQIQENDLVLKYN